MLPAVRQRCPARLGCAMAHGRQADRKHQCQYLVHDFARLNSAFSRRVSSCCSSAVSSSTARSATPGVSTHAGLGRRLEVEVADQVGHQHPAVLGLQRRAAAAAASRHQWRLRRILLRHRRHQRQDDHRDRAERQQHLPAQPGRPVCCPAPAPSSIAVRTRCEKCCQNSGDGSGTLTCFASASTLDSSASSRWQCSHVVRCAGARQPACLPCASISSSESRCVMVWFRESSSGSRARERSWPSPRRPNCRACRRSADATGRDRSAGSASRAASSAARRSPVRTATARSSRSMVVLRALDARRPRSGRSTRSAR